MAIPYFVKQKRFVGQGRLGSPSLLESGKSRAKTNKVDNKKHNNNNNNNNNKLDKINKTTNPSKIDAICAQNVCKFILKLDFSIFRTSKGNFP